MEVTSRMPGRVLPVLLTIDPTIAAGQGLGFMGFTGFNRVYGVYRVYRV